MKARILLVEDDPVIRATVRDELVFEGFAVDDCDDGLAGLERATTSPYDLVIADWGLPGLSGLELCRELRNASAVPIILLTARGNEFDRVRGLEVGADDYIVKPFSLPELVSRIRAILRRRALDRSEGRGATIRTVAGIALDTGDHTVTVDGVRHRLTPTEYRLMLLLFEHPGQVLSRRQVMEHLWESSYTGDGRSADTHISTLRKKIERDPKRPERLITVRGIGYKLDA